MPGRAGVAVVAGVIAVLVLSGCSAGQLAETSEEVSTVDGTAANVGQIALRDITLEFPSDQLYEKGDDARLQFVAVNEDTFVDDALIDVGSDAASSVQTESGGTQIPADSSVEFRGDGPTITLVGLRQELLVGEYVPVTFSFQKAGTVTVMVTVANPLEEIDRGQPYDFQDNGLPKAP